MDKQGIKVVLAGGKVVEYEPDRLRRSLTNSGAPGDLVDTVMKKVEDELYDGISTKKIYQLAFGLLRKGARPSAAKYKLKTAIMELGPSGYPFERFIGEILNREGYQTTVGITLDGHCVDHEVDVLAKKGNEVHFIECKFHGRNGVKSDVKVALYVNSRFYDLQKKWKSDHPNEDLKCKGWLVTNTRFTADAIQYGSCAGMTLIGWDFPKHGSLKERIDLSGLYPLTCLTTLNKNEKKRLLDAGIVLVRDIIQAPMLLNKINVGKAKQNRIMQEATALCMEVGSDCD